MRLEVLSLGDAVREDGGVLQTGPFGSQLKQAEYADEGVPVIMPKDIQNGEVATETVARVPEATADRLARHRIAVNGIVLPRRGEVTKRAFIGEQQAGWLCGTGCIKIETTGLRVWPKYLYYFLGAPRSIEWLERNAVGSTMLNLSAEIVSRFPIRLPTIEIQEEIAAILAAYDDLIENNRRRIALLEEAARLLYREWFVHFRFPGHEHVKIADGLPKGWKPFTLGEIATIRKGKNITQSTVEEGDVPVVAGGIKPAYHHSMANALGPVVTVSASGANAGHVALYHMDIWASDCSYLSAAENPEIWYLFLAMKSRQAEITGMQQGAAQPHVYPKHLERLSVVCPPANLRKLLHESVDSSLRQIATLEKQNQKLVKARDLLLPRLMSGEIAV